MTWLHCIHRHARAYAVTCTCVDVDSNALDRAFRLWVDHKADSPVWHWICLKFNNGGPNLLNANSNSISYLTR